MSSGFLVNPAPRGLAVQYHAQHPLLFSGIDSVEIHQTGQSLYQTLKNDPNPYVGKPIQFLFKHPVALKTLDTALTSLITLVQQGKGEEYPETGTITIGEGATTEHLHYQFVGRGNHVVTYKLSDGDKDYALKIYLKRPVSHLNPLQVGGYSELGLSSYLSQFEICDLAKFYGGYAPNWGLWEFVDDTIDPTQRPGITLAEFCQEHNFTLGDDTDYNRSKLGVRYDMGRIHPNTWLTNTVYTVCQNPIVNILVQPLKRIMG